MKELKPLDFVSLACSKDKTRYNLIAPYNDNGKLIATDGRRLHIVENFKPVYKGYINGLDAVFPEYENVTRAIGRKVATISLDTDRVKTLTKIAKLIKCVTTPAEFSFKPNALSPNFWELTITINDLSNALKISFGPLSVIDVIAPTKEFDLSTHKFGINLQFFLDAIAMAVNSSPVGYENIELVLSNDPLDVICFRFRENFQALIMPMRLGQSV